MWPKATYVLEEVYYHWRRERGGWGEEGGRRGGRRGGQGGHVLIQMAVIK